MKKNLAPAFLIAIFCMQMSFAGCNRLYTIGAYDEEFNKHVTVIKPGKLTSSEVPTDFPKVLLESDGSYAGGEVFCSVKQACAALKQLSAKEDFPKDQKWHVYVIDAEWKKDTYKLRADEYRIKNPATVIELAKKNC